jgi:hypothetical protein
MASTSPEFFYLEGAFGADVTRFWGNSVQIRRREAADIEVGDLAPRLRPIGRLEKTAFSAACID